MLRTPSLLLAGVVLLPILFGPACATGRPTKNQDLTPLAQLPEEFATAWRAWRDETPEWREWRPRVKADAKLANFFVDNLVRLMIKSYEDSGLRPRGELAGPFERASRELVYLQDYSAPVMIELIPMGDTIVSFLAGDILMQIDDGRWCLPLAKKLQGGKAEDRRRAAEWLGKLPGAGDEEEAVWELLEKTLADPDWTVRVQGATTIGLRATARGRVDLARAPLSRALGDSNPDVVKAACKAIGKGGDLNCVPALINLLERGERAQEFHLIRAAQETLEQLTKQKGHLGSAAWRNWWGIWWKANRS